ncbi:MAG: UDP-2,4-diacetamido-2,4,6-trideoxy-beta-L-altropyranose hydrolase [Sulfuricurvum sp.]|nr:UDP-2,4-diacetamido-2,4,6-trideoxy-beta-L-altropyranose hydrolase [Sulfuricurvum sp.]
MNLLIRSDSSSFIGLGHIMRDLVLAGQYPHATISFACRDLVGNINDRIPYSVHILMTDDPQELISLIQIQKIDRVIFDHYGIDHRVEKTVKESTDITVISLDDTYQKHHCDILINPNLYADPSKYKDLLPPHAMIRCGKEFLLIRDEFYQAKRTPKKKTNAIFIAMGGSDPLNLSMEILYSLPSDRVLHLVTTSSNPHLDVLKEYERTHQNLQLHINASNIAQLMNESALAIITPSSIAHEVIFMELPFIAIQSANNQCEFVAYMEREGMNVMKKFEKQTFENLLKASL